MGELPEALIQIILRKCTLQDVVRASCVDHRWFHAASDEALWQDFCLRDFDLGSPSDHLRNPCSSFKEAYKTWHENFSKYPISLVLRMKKCWDLLRSWASANYPRLAASLRPGVSENFLDQKEAELGWTLPLPLRLLYRFCDGQDLSTNSEEDLSDDGDRYEDDEREGSTCPGLLGGYRFYDHEVDIKFLSLDMVILLKEKVIPKLKRLEAQNWIIIAASVPLMKFFLLNCRDGSLHVGTGNCASDGKVMSCVPPHPDSSTMQDSILRWLEEYVRRLNSGMYKVQRDRGVSRISLFPDQGPWCTEAVSQGVQVKSAAVFVPERSTFLDEDGLFFTYQISMSLLPSGEGSHAHSFQTCQLSHRHWMILENGVLKDEVRAAAVIGQYPLLETGGKPFVYASCSSLSARKGSMRGSFTFFPGSLARPEGPMFLATVAEFPLEFPDFIF